MFQDIVNAFSDAIGSGNPVQRLSVLEMSLRAALAFFIAVALVRIGPTRLLGRPSAFDAVLTLLLGSILSRAVNGSAPFTQTVVACAVLIALHWLLAAITYYSHAAGRVLKGESVVLVKDGRLDERAMRATTTSRNDLFEALRLNAQTERLEDVRVARLERSGQISVLKDAAPRVVEVAVEPGVQTVRIRLE